MFELKFKVLKQENWYGGSVSNANFMPLTRRSIFFADNSVNKTYNQSVPFYVSSMGRYIWSEDGFSINFKFGNVACYSETSEIKLYEGFGDLRGAYLKASHEHFPPDHTMPNELMFSSPQYCTWIELLHDQTQDKILAYAKSIIDCGMPSGELLIDDGWQTGFGDWSFDKKKFTDPKGMIKTLHEMGFKVIMWICPFISRDVIGKLIDASLLVKDKNNDIAYRNWWNGNDALLDLSNPQAMIWFKDTANKLISEYGVDGFKQDAGDSFYYEKTDITCGHVSPNEQSILWAESARDYKFNELRACFKCGGYGIAQRLSDRGHQWNQLGGVRALIPNACLHGIMGYPYTCPDMIGGGQSGDFEGKDPATYDHELFVRYAQASALMPMMQYSLSLWKINNPVTAKLCREACFAHEEFTKYILELARQASLTGEPIIRFMEYNYPHQKLAKASQQFMLGDKYIVAPMVWKKKKIRKIMLPVGSWRMRGSGEVIEGGRTIKLNVPLNLLPIFEKID